MPRGTPSHHLLLRISGSRYCPSALHFTGVPGSGSCAVGAHEELCHFDTASKENNSQTTHSTVPQTHTPCQATPCTTQDTTTHESSSPPCSYSTFAVVRSERKHPDFWQIKLHSAHLRELCICMQLIITKISANPDLPGSLQCCFKSEQAA